MNAFIAMLRAVVRRTWLLSKLAPNGSSREFLGTSRDVEAIADLMQVVGDAPRVLPPDIEQLLRQRVRLGDFAAVFCLARHGRVS